ncbi:MAG: hypothetical protein Q8S73_38780 [Deltaproteobacteria bacterium]|nr:hypothetical protein [Myxococcales bacterium]MDP3220111.1 hypothetical protein [Deltaproteobacteria bacterium]
MYPSWDGRYGAGRAALRGEITGLIRAEDIVAEHPPAVDMVIKEITAARAAGPDCG